MMRAVTPMVFFALAAGFVLVPVEDPVPRTERVAADRSVLDGAPLRQLIDDPTHIDIGGVQLSCHECHKLFESPAVTHKTLNQHTHIELDHGLNDRCLNCHARADRDRFELHDGSLIPMTEVPQLCGKCHGPTWRDWDMGMHGRTSGHWDASRGPRQRLVCTECHDPHAPAVDPIAPLPGPHTLRMGSHPESDGHESTQRNPLMPHRSPPAPAAPSAAPDAPTQEHGDG